MAELNVKLPDWAAEYLEQQVSEGRFASPEDCLINLLDRARQVKAAQQRLVELILEGENSGEGVEYSEADWPSRRDQIIAELKKKSA